MRIAMGADHAGFEMKVMFAGELKERGHEVIDLGTDAKSPSVDYPDYAAAVGRMVSSGDADLGVLVCGTGIGMSIAANKIPGVRAAVVFDVTSGRLAREHNYANVVCIGSRLLGPSVALDAVTAWLEAEPASRHATRIAKIAALDAAASHGD